MQCIYYHFIIWIVSFKFFCQVSLNNHHNFSDSSWKDGDRCMICQEPLNKNLELPDVPIWNQLDTNSSYRVYSVSTLAGEVGHPNGHSKNCLSCHDGTIAEDLLQ